MTTLHEYRPMRSKQSATWSLQFVNSDPNGFDDCFAFWSPTQGLTMADASGDRFPVLRTLDGSFHTFVEVEAKQAARECGATDEGNTRQMWESIWNRQPQ